MLGSLTAVSVSILMSSGVLKKFHPVQTFVAGLVSAVLIDQYASKELEKGLLKHNKNYSSECFYQELMFLCKQRPDFNMLPFSSYGFTFWGSYYTKESLFEFIDHGRLNNIDNLLENIEDSLNRLDYLWCSVDQENLNIENYPLQRLKDEYSYFNDYLQRVLEVLDSLKQCPSLSPYIPSKVTRLSQLKSKIHDLVIRKAKLPVY